MAASESKVAPSEGKFCDSFQKMFTYVFTVTVPGSDMWKTKNLCPKGRTPRLPKKKKRRLFQQS